MDRFDDTEFIDINSMSSSMSDTNTGRDAPEKTSNPNPPKENRREPVKPYQICAYLYLIAALGFFPLYSKHSYTTLAQDKLDFFSTITWWFLPLALLAGVITFLMHPSKSLHARPKPISVTDIGMLAFFAVGIISWQLSSYPQEAYWGSDYRHHGLVMVTLYFVAYLLLSRTYREWEWSHLLFLVAGCAVIWIGLQNFFGNDILGFRFHSYSTHFGKSISTLGNLNFFSSYVCMFLALTAMMVLRGKHWFTRIFYYIGTIFGFGALIFGNSDSGFFGVGILLLLLPMFVRNFSELSRLMAVFASLFISAKLLGIWIHSPDAQLKYYLSGFSQSLIDGVHGWVLFGVLLAAAVVFFIIGKLAPQVSFPFFIKWIWFGFLCVAGIFVLMMVYRFSILDTQTELGKLENYLRFNDNWGTYRGYAWKRALEAFQNYDIKDILVGTGLDTAEHIFMPRYYQEMMNLIGEYFENVHNEYLQYLVTIGVFGVTAYVAAIASCVTRAFRGGKNSPVLLALGMAVLCYAVQGIFNISQTMTTPVFFVLLGMAEGASRRQLYFQRKEKQEGKPAGKAKGRHYSEPA